MSDRAFRPPEVALDLLAAQAEIATLREHLTTATTHLARLRVAVQRVEWQQGTMSWVCPVCRRRQDLATREGHAPGCAMAALVRVAEEG